MEENLKLIANLVDWPSSNIIMDKIFYDTFGTVLIQKLAELEASKASLKEFIRENFSEKLNKTPTRHNPTTRLTQILNNMHVADFGLAPNSSLIRSNVLPPKMKLQAAKKPAPAPPMPSHLPVPISTSSHNHEGTVPTAPSSASVKSAAPVCSVQLIRQKEREMLAAKRREEALRNKAERTRRDHEERQLRVQKNNMLRKELQMKLKQEMREKEDRLRKFRKEQDELERGVRSPAAKSRKMGTPRSARKPLATIQMASNEAFHPPPSPQMPELPAPPVVPEPVVEFHEPEPENVAQSPTPEPAVEFHTPDPAVEFYDSARTAKSAESAAKSAKVVAKSHESQEEQVGQFHTPEARKSYEMTPDKVFLPSTKENYNVDDLSSADETDNDENPRKQIPKWAHRSNLILKITRLRTLITPSQCEHHFGRICNPEIESFFSNYEKSHAARSSSAIWESPMSDPTPGFSRFAI